MKLLTKNIIQKIYKPREATSHKGNHGHALIIAGSMGRMGATVIAARACLRTGTGLLTVNVPQEERFILQTTIPEAMLIARENTAYNIANFSTVCIGQLLV